MPHHVVDRARRLPGLGLDRRGVARPAVAPCGSSYGEGQAGSARKLGRVLTWTRNASANSCERRPAARTLCHSFATRHGIWRDTADFSGIRSDSKSPRELQSVVNQRVSLSCLSGSWPDLGWLPTSLKPIRDPEISTTYQNRLRELVHKHRVLSPILCECIVGISFGALHAESAKIPRRERDVLLGAPQGVSMKAKRWFAVLVALALMPTALFMVADLLIPAALLLLLCALIAGIAAMVAATSVRHEAPPGFITLFAGELGYSALLDEATRSGPITCFTLALHDPKSYEFRAHPGFR